MAQMTQMKRIFTAVLVAIACVLAACRPAPPPPPFDQAQGRQAVLPAERAIVILVSIDGFRWDYLDRYQAPNLARLAAQGVRSEGLIPQFPSKTFPNHYTIVTGLRLANHGIVSNNMRAARHSRRVLAVEPRRACRSAMVERRTDLEHRGEAGPRCARRCSGPDPKP